MFFPRDMLLVEILEDVVPDKEVLEACKQLKKSGFRLAIDDFAFHKNSDPFLEIVDIVKIDFQEMKGEDRKYIVKMLVPYNVNLLAEKLETHEDFKEAARIGYSFFQGYFFSKPIILSHQDIPGFKLNYLKILQEICRPELNFRRLEDTIKHEVSIAYKLLRYVNSASKGRRCKIKSISQSLSSLGEINTRKLVSLMILKGLGTDKPQELILNAVIRAKFCELIASDAGMVDKESELFLMGMFSLIDAIIGKPMKEVLSEISISDAVKTALIGGKNHLSDVYELVITYEVGRWEKVSKLASNLKLKEVDVAKYYYLSIKWANWFLEI